MKRIFTPTQSASDWQRLLGKPKLHWKRGFSAMAAAASWESNAPALPPEIVCLLEGVSDSFANLELVAAIPEWEVDLPGGDRPSQTDVLAVCRNEVGLTVLGVEAKVNEPFGPTLGEKRTDASAGQLERIAYLADLLGASEPLDDEIRYQLLHRTGSALLAAREFHAQNAVMVVQSFSPTQKWRKDFEQFAAALGAVQIEADLFEVHLESHLRLLLGWCTGDAQYLEVELPSIL